MPGDPIFVDAWIKDPQGRPVVGAKVDVWHTSAERIYENQDPTQADMSIGWVWIGSLSDACRAAGLVHHRPRTIT